MCVCFTVASCIMETVASEAEDGRHSLGRTEKGLGVQANGPVPAGVFVFFVWGLKDWTSETWQLQLRRHRRQDLSTLLKTTEHALRSLMVTTKHWWKIFKLAPGQTCVLIRFNTFFLAIIFNTNTDTLCQCFHTFVNEKVSMYSYHGVDIPFNNSMLNIRKKR